MKVRRGWIRFEIKGGGGKYLKWRGKKGGKIIPWQ